MYFDLLIIRGRSLISVFEGYVNTASHKILLNYNEALDSRKITCRGNFHILF